MYGYFQHNTIEAVLQRGEKLDDLVDKSEGLSMQSKAFYKTVSLANIEFSYRIISFSSEFYTKGKNHSHHGSFCY